MGLTYQEIVDIFYMKHFPSQRTFYTLPSGIYEISDSNKTLEYFLPEIVKVSITINDIRLNSKLHTNQTLIFNNKSFFIEYWDLSNLIQDP